MRSLPVRSRQRWLPEWYFVNQGHIRILAMVFAAIQIAAAAVWALRSWRLWSEPESICAGRCEEAWFRWAQAALAAAGIVLAIVLAAYLVRIALRDRTWRRRRSVAIAFGAVAAAWSALVITAVNNWP